MRLMYLNSHNNRCVVEVERVTVRDKDVVFMDYNGNTIKRQPMQSRSAAKKLQMQMFEDGVLNLINHKTWRIGEG